MNVVAKLMLAGVAAAVLAGPGLAEEARASRPLEAASLHEGPLDVVAYYVPLEGGALEVTATFAQKTGAGAAPVRTVMVLGDGDAVAFAMPGHGQALYRFARAAAVVTVSVEMVPQGLVAARGAVASQ